MSITLVEVLCWKVP